MPTFAELTGIHAHPEPAYPEYSQLRARASAGQLAVARQFGTRAAIGGHSADWCTAVLGRPCGPAGIRSRPWTLVLAVRQAWTRRCPPGRRWRDEASSPRPPAGGAGGSAATRPEPFRAALDLAGRPRCAQPAWPPQQQPVQ